MSQKTVLWLGPAFLALHNLEEAILMPRVLPVVGERIPPALARLLPPLGYTQFLIALLIVTAIPLAVAAASDLRARSTPGVYLLLATQAVLTLNIVSHLGSAVVLGGYAPGVITAIIVNLPFSWYLFRRASRERWLTTPALASLVPIAVLLHGPGLLGLLIVSGRIAALWI